MQINLNLHQRFGNRPEQGGWQMPHRFVTQKWLFGLMVSMIVWLAAAIAGFQVFGVPGMLIVFAAGLFVVIYLLLEIVLRMVHLKRRTERDFEQIFAAMGLYAAMKPEWALLPIRGWAASPDLAVLYMELIRDLKPELILELGSGLSSIIATNTLKKNGTGKLISVDNDETFAGITRNNLLKHGLEDGYEIRHAPLESVQWNGQNRNWYSMKTFEDVKDVDLLVIDGPWDGEDTLNRAPALELLKNKLSKNATILIDDALRPNWRKNAIDWAEKNGFLVIPYDLEKGALVLKRVSEA